MKTKIIKTIRLILAISVFSGIIFLLCKWPIETIIGLFAFSQIKEHWKEVKMFLITTAIACTGGAIMVWIIHLIFTGSIYIQPQSMWSIGYLFTTIYALGLLIEEDQQKPYIWLWRQMKKVKRLILNKEIIT
ncbi:MAG: hypothetical protein WC875_04765 [Candidatus Absconditabacterales bacterium]|jgi:hypothetical protein